MKRLILLRHATAAWTENGGADSDRTLTDVGRAECVAQANWLAASGHPPQHALVSAATRARETWDIMREHLSPRPLYDVHEDLYLAEPDTLLAHIETLPDHAETAIVVAHNPGIENLARMLSGVAPDVAAMRDMSRGYPTAGLGVFEMDVESWEQLTVAQPRLTAFARPQVIVD